MINQDYVNAFNAFESNVSESPVFVKHSGTQGATIECDTVALWLEWDESGAEESWCNFLDSEGLGLTCSLEDAVNGNFPELEVNVCFSVEFDSSNTSMQDDNATTETIAILKKIIKRLERASGTDEHINSSIHDTNGNPIGSFNFSVSGE